MCGIFAWAGKNPNKFDRSKFDILGMFNITRGKHSCGVSIDGDIKVGVDGLKVYTDFITKGNKIEDPKSLPVVIGHTRHATYGQHTVANAHPFGFGRSAKYNYNFIGVHNGTLLNHRDLAKKYEVPVVITEKTADNKEVTRTKIDSEILLECIYKNKNFKILSEYNGAAALVFYNIQEPDTIYCYHGKSLAVEGGKTVEEERPLYYYKETRNSLYISSIEASLRAIATDNSKIGEFDHNVVYKITNGNIEKAIKFTIARKDNFQKASYFTKREKSTPNINNIYGYNKRNNFNRSARRKNNRGNRGRNSKKKSYNTEGGLYNIGAEIPRLGTPEIGGRPTFNRLRFQRNGHLVSGVYLYIPFYGMYFVAENKKDAITRFENSIKGRKFSKKDGLFGDYGTSDDKVIFKADILNPPFKYLYDGIMLRTADDFSACVTKEKLGKKFNWKQLSHAAAHPIIDHKHFKPTVQQEVLWEGKHYTGGFSMMGTYRNYEFKDGNLISMTDLELPKALYLKKTARTEHMYEVNDKPIQLPMNFTPEPAPVVVLNDDNIDPVIVLDTIDKVFEDVLTTLPLGKQQLKKYLPNKEAEKAIKAIDEFTDKIISIN